MKLTFVGLVALTVLVFSACEGDDPAPYETPSATVSPIASQEPLSPTALLPFSGELNGIKIAPGGPFPSPAEICPPSGFEAALPDDAAAAVESPGPLGIDLSSLSSEVEVTGDRWVYLCDGEPVIVNQSFSIHVGTADVAPGGGGTLFVRRHHGETPIDQAAPADRWETFDVNGLPAVAARAHERFGACFIAVWDPSTQVMTTIHATTGFDPFCRRIAEALSS